jgi:2-C-methyl-D-erythritol 4-phosphate cytidylyltransferase
MESPIPKAFVPLAGRPMFAFSLEAMAASGVVDFVVLVVPPGELQRAKQLLEELRPPTLDIAEVVTGGPTRQWSVRRGLDAVHEAARWALCHDAARPFATASLHRRVVETLAGEDADGVVPLIRSHDTVKRTRQGLVIETIPRTEAGMAQTPQGFSIAALREAHRRAQARGQADATDDAMLLEEAGLRVVAVEGEEENFKITTREDFRRAEAVVGGARRVRTVG